MGWFDILKYNREHYVEASKKHNDPETIETHKEILELVEASPRKDKAMGRRIAQLKAKKLDENNTVGGGWEHDDNEE
tara:strand:+ start:34 stop:264 length:231 start_codon:yes stop_codon:yes gene_type:complete